jgi:hypothetical protein
MTDDDKPPKPSGAKSPPDFLDGSMTRSQLVAVLEGIRFPQRSAAKPVEIDADVRDILPRRPAAPEHGRVPRLE